MIEVSEKKNYMSVAGCCDSLDGATVHLPDGSAEQVKLMSALSDPTRLQIVAMLAQLDEPLCVCEIQASFDLGQPTISHHLKVLREARLVTWEKRGLWVYYSLDRATLEQATLYLSNLLSLKSSSLTG
ncbi:MAG: ArsR/SmtB family transcription factor [Chloroflexia bacterium]|jgi:ArsR family transcriptional regulator